MRHENISDYEVVSVKMTAPQTSDSEDTATEARSACEASIAYRGPDVVALARKKERMPQM